MSYSHSFKTILYSLRFIILSTIIFFHLNRLYRALHQSYRLLLKYLLFNEKFSALGLLFTVLVFRVADKAAKGGGGYGLYWDPLKPAIR